MDDFRIAVAQTRPIKGDIEANIRNHIRFISNAAEQKANMIIFPELSLTGYEPVLAADLAIKADDKAFDLVRRLSSQHDITAVAGAPIVNTGGKPFIGSICFGSFGQHVYLKQHLHPGEEKFFSNGNEAGILNIKDTVVGLAICADIAHASHPEMTSRKGATIYAASVFVTPQGYDNDTGLLRSYALRYGMSIAMANFCGESGGMKSAGRSAIWDERGRLIIKAGEFDENLIIAEKTSTNWDGILL